MIKNYDRIKELENELLDKTEDEIIEDLSQLSIKALCETSEILKDFLYNLYEEQLNNDKSIVETTKALERINIALNSKLEDLTIAEKITKTLLDY